MKNDHEVIDSRLSEIPLTIADLGTLAVAEFSIYFQDLPEFTPSVPGDRPVLDTHIGTWVEPNNQKFGYALLWQTRPQEDNHERFQVDSTLVKVSRDPDDLRIIESPKRFDVYSNVSTPVMGERLSHLLNEEELKLVQHIVRKNQKNMGKAEIPVDKFVVAALIECAGQFKPKKDSRQKSR